MNENDFDYPNGIEYANKYLSEKVLPYIPKHYNADVGGLVSLLNGGERIPMDAVASSGDTVSDLMARTAGSAMASTPVIDGIIKPLTKEFVAPNKLPYANTALATALLTAIAYNRAANEGNPMNIEEIMKTIGRKAAAQFIKNKPKSKAENNNDSLQGKEYAYYGGD